MNERTPDLPHARVTLVFHIVLWVWLIVLSAVTLIHGRMMPRLAWQAPFDAVQRQQRAFDERLSTLDEAIRTLCAPPQTATVAALQNTREALEARLAPVEQAVSAQITAKDLAVLRTDIEQLKARHAAKPPAPVTVRPRETRPVVVAPKAPPIPFRVIGTERRAGQRSVSIVPLTAASPSLSADRIQPVLVGESVGAWRLDAIDGQTAVFRAGEQTRRVAVP